MAPAIAIRDALAGYGVEARLVSHLSRRDDGSNNNNNNNNIDPSAGVLDPHDMNNVGFFFLFALIGVAFVLAGIWFFFWAKNGGFHFRDDDWDDYKSTVMRRKGPNGTILSNATKSTKLGGGSIYNKAYDYDDGNRTEITDSTAMSGITAGPSDIYAREKREQKRRRREAERRKKRGGEKKRSSRAGGAAAAAAEGVLDEEAEKMAREQLRNYREERPARVGGINKMAEGSDWEGSTNPASSMLSGSAMQSSSALSSAMTATEFASEAPPPPYPPQTTSTSAAAAAAAAAAGVGGGASGSRPPASKGGGIRKVYSVADRTTARENERLRAEARRLREEGRSNARRELTYQRANGSGSRDEQTESLLSGAGHGGGSGMESVSAAESSTLSREHGGGTKSYHHPLPELREHWRREREEKRARRGGYQRGKSRDEELEDEVD